MAYLFTCDGCESNRGSHGHSSKDIKDVYNPVSEHFSAWDFFQVPLVWVVWHMQIILGLESQGVTTKKVRCYQLYLCIFFCKIRTKWVLFQENTSHRSSLITT